MSEVQNPNTNSTQQQQQQQQQSYSDSKINLLKKLKQLEKINGRLAMGGLIYLVFTKLVSNRADILDQLKSYLI